MNTQDIVAEAVRLTPQERARVIEALLSSLDQPDPKLDHAWAMEAEARLLAVREGRLATVPAGDVLGRQ